MVKFGITLHYKYHATDVIPWGATWNGIWEWNMGRWEYENVIWEWNMGIWEWNMGI